MRKPGKRKDYGKLIIKMIFLLSVFYVLFTFYDQHREMDHLKKCEDNLLEDINRIEDDIQTLKNRIENSNTDEHIEKIAREHLKMVKKGELIFIDMGGGHN